MSKINLLPTAPLANLCLKGSTWTSWLKGKGKVPKSTHMYPKVPKSTLKYQKVPKSTLKYQNTKVPKLGLLGCKTLAAIPSTIAPYHYCHY